jgi:nucleotide-binding universal stress UspA family protein
MKTPAGSGKVSLGSVLFATDFSAASMRALPYALGMASRFGSKLYTAHVVSIEPYLVGSPKAVDRLRQARQEADASLASLLDSVSKRGIPCQPLVDNGDIWGVLSRFIKEYGVDLLVIGTTGRTGLGKVLLGSVAEEAIRESPCPVLAVGPRAPSDENVHVQNILYATDFSTDSLLAAPYALSFAEKFRARLSLLHVIEKLPESPYLDAQMARVRLNELITPQVDLATTPEATVEMGSPADVILKVATDTASDLIVIGARGAGAFARFATHFGSIAHKVVSHAACPVLTVGGPRDGSVGTAPGEKAGK